MKILFILIVLFFNSCKSSLPTDIKLYVGMNKTEAKEIFDEYFNDDGLLSFFLPLGETRDKSRWDGRTYVHAKTKFIIKCIYLDDKVYSLRYIDSQNYDRDTGRETGYTGFLDSIVFNSEGIQYKVAEPDSKKLRRKKLHQDERKSMQ